MYADVQLVCDPSDRHELYSERPCVVVEVLSESTARTDYGEKLHACQSIPTLQAYLIVSQKERRVVRHWRTGALGTWAREDLTDGAVGIPCLGVDLALDAIYAEAAPPVAPHPVGRPRQLRSVTPGDLAILLRLELS